MKKCPRCHRNTLYEEGALNSLSRRDSKTYICSACGRQEAHIDNGYMKPGRIERNFVAAVCK